MAKIPKKYKNIIKEYVLVEVPKIFAPEEIVNIPEWFLTEPVMELIYASWERECLIKEQKSDFLNNLYKRTRGKYNYRRHDIDANLTFDDHVFESYHPSSVNESRYSHLFRSSPLRQMPRVSSKIPK